MPLASHFRCTIHAAVAAQARRTAASIIKAQARRYIKQPALLDSLLPGLDLDNLDLYGVGLSGLAVRRPSDRITILRSLCALPVRWFGFGGEVPAINLRAAMLHARHARYVDAAHVRAKRGQANG